jgi:hypothetical protein
MGFENLFKTQAYVHQIEKIFAKHRRTGRVYEMQQENVSLAEVHQDRHTFARLLCEELRLQNFRFAPAEIVEIQLEKKRRIHRLALTDLLVNGVFARALIEEMRKQGFVSTPPVFSYFKNSSRFYALAHFSDFLRRHRKGEPDPKKRGVLVARRDVRRYTENVPVDDSSELWLFIANLLRDGRCAEPEAVLKIYRSIIRPRIKDVNSETLIGLPTGTPITAAIYNLYLNPVDREFMQATGGCYLRYSDDLLFAHANQETFQKTIERAEVRLRELRLEFNSKKSRTVFFNGAGRPLTEAGFSEGAQQISLLGASVRFNGTVGLGPTKSTKFLRDLRTRLRRAARLLGTRSPEERASLLCQIANDALFTRSPLRTARADLIEGAVTDRAQLKHFDSLVALYVAEACTGIPSPRSHRALSPRRLRREFGLKSLVLVRNQI